MRNAPDLASALRTVVDRIDATVRGSGYRGDPVRMILAGGLAAHFYSRTRYTTDIDASFSHRLLLPHHELTAQFISEGREAVLHFDSAYNPNFALMHPDYQQDAWEWKGIGNEQRIVKVFVLSPIDLAVSKVSRFSDADRGDIQALARDGHISIDAFKKRADEALDYYIGNKDSLARNVSTAIADIERHAPRPRSR